MKNFIYIPIILLITVFAGCNIKIVDAKTKGNQTLISNSFTGEKLISNKEFVQSINRTCEDDDNEDDDKCTVLKIKKIIISNFVT